jgi:hypothetical protein
MAINTLTNAQMRSLAQKLVRDTAAISPGLASADWTDLLNVAMYDYCEIYPDDPGIAGFIGTAAVQANASVSDPIVMATATSVIKSVTFVSASGGRPIPLKPVGDIFRQVQADPSFGTIQECAFYTNGVPNPVVAGTSIDRVIVVWKQPSILTSLSISGTCEPTPLSADGDYTPFMQSSCRVIARMAAYDAARMLGRPSDFTQMLGATLPDKIAAHKGVIKRALAPRYFEGKAVG